MTKFTFSKSHFSQNSHLFKYQIQMNLWIKSLILPQCGFLSPFYCYQLKLQLNFLLDLQYKALWLYVVSLDLHHIIYWSRKKTRSGNTCMNSALLLENRMTNEKRGQKSVNRFVRFSKGKPLKHVKTRKQLDTTTPRSTIEV